MQWPTPPALDNDQELCSRAGAAGPEKSSTTDVNARFAVSRKVGRDAGMPRPEWTHAEPQAIHEFGHSRASDVDHAARRTTDVPPPGVGGL
jgi:hypothetical protein